MGRDNPTNKEDAIVTRSKFLPRKARRRWMPNPTRTVIRGTPFFPMYKWWALPEGKSINEVPEGYAYNGRGDLIRTYRKTGEARQDALTK